MGLDISYDCWHGAYSAFSRWRNELAKAAGYAIADIKWEDGTTTQTILVDWGHLQDKLFGDWKKTPDDPLLVLIAHSDCEGKIKPAQCKPLADRIEKLLPLLPKGDGGGHIYDWQVVTQQFIDGLREAFKDNKSVEFG